MIFRERGKRREREKKEKKELGIGLLTDLIQN